MLNFHYLQVMEDPLGSNRGDWIDEFNEYLELAGCPWCATNVSYCDHYGHVQNQVKSARAKDHAKGGYSLQDVNLGIYVPKPGDKRVKTRRGGHHVDYFLSWDQETQSGLLIGGNVGDAVTIRGITLKDMVADGTTHIVDVRGLYDYRVPYDEGFMNYLEKHNVDLN